MRIVRLEYGFKEQVDSKGEVVKQVAELGIRGVRKILRQGNNFAIVYRDRIEKIENPDVFMIGVPRVDDPTDNYEFNYYDQLMRQPPGGGGHHGDDDKVRESNMREVWKISR